MQRQPGKKDLVVVQEFEWLIVIEGYEWNAAIPPDGKPGIALTAEYLTADRKELRRTGFPEADFYEGPVHPALFVDFANTPWSREGIEYFAYTNGLLGISDAWAESQADWRRQIQRMKLAIDLATSKVTADEDRAAEIANEELDAHTDFRLVRDSNTDPLRPRCIPRNLLGAMWLQFTMTVDTDARFRNCRVCEKTMLLAPWIPGGRSNQSMYCDKKCNQKAKRMRAKGHKMLINGASRRKVAEELGVEASWLREQGL